MPRLVPVAAALALGALAAHAGPGDAIKQLKRALGPVAREQGFVADDDPRLAALGEAIAAVGAQGDEDAAKALMGLLRADFPSASVEVFAAERSRDALIDTEGAEARETVRETLEKKRRDLVLAPALAEVVSAWPEPASAEVLAVLLEQRSERVVMAGARGLGRLGLAEGVRPLIEVFEDWQERGGQPIETIGDALFDITGRSFTSQEDWEKWWGGVEDDWDPSQRSAGAGETRTRDLQPGDPPSMFESVEIRSRRVVIILDTSGSMHIKKYVHDPLDEGPDEAAEGEGSQTRGDGDDGDGGDDDGGVDLGGGPALPHGDPTAPGYEPKKCTFHQCPAAKGRQGATCPSDDKLPEYYNRLQRLVRQVELVVRRFDPSVRFNMVAFSTDARPWRGRDLVDAGARDKRSAIQWLQSLQPDGVTSAGKALEEAFTFEDADTFIFVTDGAPTDPSGAVLGSQEIRALLDEVQRQNRVREVQIDVIGIAEGATGFARQLASENGGQFVRVP